MRAALRGFFASALAGGVVLISAASANGQIAWSPCASSVEFACGHLTVALDPGGSVPGVITLALRRHRAPVGEAREAVIALAGGPGQAALPFTEDFVHLLGPVLSTRDLIVFDQRGVGLSHALACHRFEVSGASALGPAIAECASELGPARSYFTTAQSVADIEAIRVAGGYEKLVLYGTSYGTKVAERYAQAHPEHVSALVLDSVVPPNGPDPLARATLAAVPRVLRALCAGRACAHITHEPVADLARTVRRIGDGALRGRWIDGRGRAHRISISSSELLEILLAGDLEPTLRAEFPAAVRAAADGDTAPLARLVHGSEQRGERAESETGAESFDTPLYFATSCEEELFPWNRGSGPAKRLAEARARIGTLAPSELAPFLPRDVLAISDIPACAFWPYSSPAPVAAQAPLPAVPTLILSGSEDLRTPTSGAREVARQIPGAHLLVVPGVGHSVLGSDISGCASGALQAFFRGAAIQPCRAGGELINLLGLTPLAPARLADLAPLQGFAGTPGRTLHAVKLTLADITRQGAMQALLALGSENIAALLSLRFGGLRSGWAALENGALTLHDYSYVPGVTVSGTVSARRTRLQVGGSAAAHGMLRLGGRKTLVGALGGVNVHVTAQQAGAGDIVRADAQVSPTVARRGAAVRAAAGRVAGLLERIP
jgi:pimeloyl-ACP methyl ester carboxylesterase